MSGGKYFEEPKVNNSGNNAEARNLEAESIQRNTTDLSRYQTLKNQAMTKYESVKGNTQNDKVKYNK